MIKISKLSKHFTEKVAVKEVNFDISDGEIFALLGSNGAGKTIVISTHILEVVEALADRVRVIIDGQSVAQGTMDDVITGVGAGNLRDAFIKLNEKYHQPEGQIEEKKQKTKKVN